MVLKYHISTSAITEDFIVRIWEAASDGVAAHVYETTLVEKNGSGVPTPGAGHQVIETLTVNGLDKVVHIIRMYGAVSANLLHEYNAEPRTDLLTVFAPIRFKVGDGGPDTPAANQDICITPELISLTTDDFVITRNNFGALHPTTHFTFDDSTGTWQLVNPDQFGANEEFTIQITPQVVSTVVNDSVVGKWFGGFVDISANTNYSASHLRKLIRFAGQCTYTFQALDTVPIGYAFVFTNFGTPSGTQVCTVQFLNGNLKWANTTKTTLDIPLYYEAAFVWDGTQWNLIYFIDSRIANAGAVPTGTILGTGSVNIGDVPGGDPLYTVTHNLDITGDYNVFLQIKSNTPASAASDNRIWSTFYHDTVVADKKNKFHFSIQEFAGELQNVSICWVIIKV